MYYILYTIYDILHTINLSTILQLFIIWAAAVVAKGGFGRRREAN